MSGHLDHEHSVTSPDATAISSAHVNFIKKDVSL